MNSSFPTSAKGADPENFRLLFALNAAIGNKTPVEQKQVQSKAENLDPVDCPALQNAVRVRDAELDWARSAIAADRTLQTDARLETKMKIAELAQLKALDYFRKRCTD